MKPGEKIIHVEFNDKNLQPKSNNKKGKHFYFGSLEAIYGTFSSKEIGCSIERLYRVNIEENSPYVGRKCTIHKGILTRKKTNRKAPVKILRVV